MKSIKFNGKQVSIPTSWDEVRLGDYEKWHSSNTKDKMNYVRYLADLCKIDAEELLDAPDSNFGEIEKIMDFIFKVEFEPSQTIIIDNELYSVAASDELTLGEWIDMESIIKDKADTELSDILAIVCRPVGEKYNHEKSEERAKLFREQSCEKMLPLFSFFLLKKKRFNETLNHSLKVVAAANQYLQDTKIFVENGDGIKRLPIWQRTRYSSLMKSLEKELSKFSDFCSI